jgi:acetyltransferase
MSGTVGETEVADLPVRVRRIQPGDDAALERFYEGLSPESRQRRFFACTRGLSHPQARQFCCTDHDHREGFVALRRSPSGRREIVGHLCMEPAADGAAEIALAVADDLQGQGVGRRLARAGIAWARSAGIERLTATMLCDNVAIHRLLAGVDPSASTRSLGSGLEAMSLELRGSGRQAA